MERSNFVKAIQWANAEHPITIAMTNMNSTYVRCTCGWRHDVDDQSSFDDLAKAVLDHRKPFREQYLGLRSNPKEPSTKATKEPQVSRVGVLDMQVCVPEDWTDKQIQTFAEANNPCGTSAGWQIRKKGSKFLRGSLERTPCEDIKGKVHVTLDA